MKYIYLLFALVPFGLSAQTYPEFRTLIYEEALEPREHPVDFTHLKLQVSFVPEKGIVNGIVTHTFHPLRDKVDSIFLDAPGITIQKASRQGKMLRWKQAETGIWVFPEPVSEVGKKDSFTLEYTCTPRKGIYFIGWNDPTGRARKQIWTQGQGIDNRYWIPMYDEMNDKIISETIITFQDTFQVLSNGNLLSEKKNSNATKTWHYKMDFPHAPYLIMIGIGRYDIEKRKTSSGTPVSLWYYPEFPEKRIPTYLYSTECIEFMENMTGIPYPWKTYANIPVQDFLYGAMENTTATVFGDFILVDAREFIDRNYIGTNVHELTHQWFGDYITARSARHTWLQESYATFYPKRFLKDIYGQDYYEWQLRGEHNSALKASEKDLLPIVHSKAGSSRWYPKGSAVIDMMHYVFGEDAMKRVIHHYLKKHAYKTVETNDLYQAFQDTLGLSPLWFFDQWLYKGGEPYYRIAWNEVVTTSGKSTEISVSQIQEIDAYQGLFKMPVWLEVVYQDGSKAREMVWVEKETHTFRIQNPDNKKVDFVLFDPGSQILKKVTFNKSPEELKSQAVKASNMIDRYDALLGMREIKLEEKRDFLLGRFEVETFHAIKAEILQQFKDDLQASSVQLRLKALSDKSVEVRNAALSTTVKIPLEHKSEYANLLRDSSYSVVSSALEKLARQFPEELNSWLEITREQNGPGMRTRILRLELKAEQNDEAAVAELSDLCGQSFEFITRQNAMNALKRLNQLTPLAIKNLLNACLNPNYKLSGTAAQVLKDFMVQQKWKTLIQAEINLLIQENSAAKGLLMKQGLV
jgi:aminopeptidase N